MEFATLMAPIPKKEDAKDCSNQIIPLISHVSIKKIKIMNIEELCIFHMDNEKIEIVQDFLRLSSIISQIAASKSVEV